MKRLPTLLALTLTAMALVGCGGEQGARQTGSSSAGDTASPVTEGPWSGEVTEPEYPLTITDGGGHEITIDAPFTKVGCLYSGCEEAMADLGLLPNAILSGETPGAFLRPVGTAPFEIKDEVSAEEWAKSGSDVIVDLAGPIGEDDKRALKSVAPVVFMNAPYQVWNPDRVVPGVQAWKEDLWMMGQLTGNTVAAKAAIDRFDQFMAGLQKLAPPDAADTVVANLSVEADGVYSLTDPDSPFCDALKSYELGQCLRIDGWDADTWEVNAEAFLAADPEWIAYTVYSDKDSYTDRKDPVWQRLTAVQEGRVFDFSRTNCCGLRMLEHSLQDYAFHVWGPDSGVPDPGPENDFDPTKSPVLEAS